MQRKVPLNDFEIHSAYGRSSSFSRLTPASALKRCICLVIWKSEHLSVACRACVEDLAHIITSGPNKLRQYVKGLHRLSHNKRDLLVQASVV